MMQALCDVPSLQGKLESLLGTIAAVMPLESGTTGTSFRVETGEGCYVAKLFAPDTNVLLGPKDQFELLNRIAEHGIAPRAHAVLADDGILVTEFVAGASIDTSAMAQPKHIRGLASSLKRLHSVAVEIPGFDPLGYADRYVRQLGGQAQLAAAEQRNLAELQELAALCAEPRVCVCHNDLTAENVLFGSVATLIDFDYAVLGWPMLDLASISVMNEFAAANEAELLAAYYPDRQVPFSSTEFARVKRLVRLLAHFWSLASTVRNEKQLERYRLEND